MNGKLIHPMDPMEPTTTTMPLWSSITTSPSTTVSVSPGVFNAMLNPNDVLCGRGSRISKYSGNVQLRSMIAANKLEYLDMFTPKLQKARICARLVAGIRSLNPPGRFLELDTQGKLWVEIGDERARRKVGQGFRELNGKSRSKMQKNGEHPITPILNFQIESSVRTPPNSVSSLITFAPPCLKRKLNEVYGETPNILHKRRNAITPNGNGTLLPKLCFYDEDHSTFVSNTTKALDNMKTLSANLSATNLSPPPLLARRTSSCGLNGNFTKDNNMLPVNNQNKVHEDLWAMINKVQAPPVRKTSLCSSCSEFSNISLSDDQETSERERLISVVIPPTNPMSRDSISNCSIFSRNSILSIVTDTDYAERTLDPHSLMTLFDDEDM